MISWIKKYFSSTPTVNPYIGLFRDWISTEYVAYDPKQTYCFWIANEFYGFKDVQLRTYYHSVTTIQRGFLTHANGVEKRQIWEALNHDLFHAATNRISKGTL